MFRSSVKPRLETLAKLDEFCRYPWFQHCGEPLEGNFTGVANWSEVKRRVRSQRWDRLRGYFHHHGFIVPLQKGPARGQVLREIFIDPKFKSALHQLLFSIHQKVERYDWPSGLDGFGPITVSIRQDIGHALWEAEYSDIAVPTAFTEIRQEIYRQGRMVAGWDGTYPRRDGRDPEGWFPEGRLFVF